MSIAGHTRPSSGACHEISHALDLLYPERAASHGEQVGLGAAFAMHLRGAHEEARLMAAALRRHGLPVVAEEIGFSDDEFVRAVEFAPETRPGRYTILEHLGMSQAAIKTAYAEYADTVAGWVGSPV
jgi:glycerol-1-phosphate dehydrogenase [NAD(P)+]